MTTDMNDKLNKTTICAIAAIEIVDFSKKSDAEQINSKYSLNQLVNAALKEYARYDRILLDKGDGVVMAYLAAPEDMLAIMLDIRQHIAQHNAQGLVPIIVRIGVHLGAVRVVNDVNEQPNFMGEGLNESRRIMHLAHENGIVVSPAYYAVTLPLPNEIATFYAYSGFKKDANASEYLGYTLDLINNDESKATDIEQVSELVEDTPIEQPGHLPAYQPGKDTAFLNTLNWKYIVAGLAVLLGLLALVRMLNAPITPEIIMNAPETVAQEVIQPEPVKPAAVVLVPIMPAQSATAISQDAQGLLPNESIEELPNTQVSPTTVNNNSLNEAESAKAAVTDVANNQEKKRVNKRIVKKTSDENTVKETRSATPASTTEQPSLEKSAAESVPANVETKVSDTPKKEDKRTEKSGWDNFKESVKQGQESRTCTQGEIALGQCKN